MLSLGRLTGLPILLLGEPGVAKSQAILDFSSSLNWKTFVTQLSIGTRPSAILGTLDIPSLVKEGIQRTISPIAEADAIQIDEVDKGSRDTRNLLLSIMREKALFLGSEGVRHCKYSMFVGSCNTIPQDEENSPFWDRFVLKMIVDRVPINLFGKIWKEETQSINIPHEYGKDPIEDTLFSSFTHLVYKYITDRTLTHLPKVVRGVMGIWEYDTLNALLKVLSFVSPEKSLEIAKKLVPKEFLDAKTLFENAIAARGTDLSKELFEKGLTISNSITDSGLRKSLDMIRQRAGQAI